MHIAHNPDYIIVRRGQNVPKLKEVIDSLRLQPTEFFIAKTNVQVATISNHTVILYTTDFTVNRDHFRNVLRICGDTDVYVLLGAELYTMSFLHPNTIKTEVEGGLLCLR